jgi:hypothetical protein
MVARTKKVNPELVDAQVLTQSTAVIPVTASNVSLGTLQATSPAALVSGAAEMAHELAAVINKQQLFTVIQGKKFVGVEGWTTLAVMLGCVAREVQTTENNGIYTAIVELVRMNDGACISRASAECGDEKPWNTRPKYARRSMAQTRATGKACRLAFSWIMSLAGYEVTPAEEMTPIIEAEQEPIDGEPDPEREQSARINEPQHRKLEATINEYGLDRERVKSWINAAWNVQHLNDLTVSQFQALLKRLKVWAEREYEKAAQDYAASVSEYEAPLTYADIRG